MLPTRPCRYCLGLQDDSVFADFDIDNKGQAFLFRISFDGIGCNETGNEIRRMDEVTSNRFREYGRNKRSSVPRDVGHSV